MKILFVASECVPYAKAGGLADVVAGLPKALRRMGHDVRIVIPLYGFIDRAKHKIKYERSACVHMGNHEEQWIGVHAAKLDNEVPVWLVDCQRFFDRPWIYGDASGEYVDNAFRFALLSKAALQICEDVGFIPDVMHGHDWPTALVPVFLKLSPLFDTAGVLTIHNIGHQGKFHASAFPYIGVGSKHFTPDKFEDFGMINLLKAGIHFADAITTVSPSYAREILEPIGSQGLAPFLSARSNDLFGILNGADYDRWNPANDRQMPARFTEADLSGKAVCKAALQRRFNLEVRKDWPVFGIISRLVQQKGCDLLREALPHALDDMTFQLVVLGTGDAHHEDFFRWLRSAYPNRVGCHIGFSDELSHLIEAGSDFFLMPSLYEPCGLNQMYSMKYGTLPIVRATGGLDDTVQNYDERTGAGTGFKFLDPTPAALYSTIGLVVSTWFDCPQHIARLRQVAMTQNFSWEVAARKYIEVYARALHVRRA